MSTKLFHSGSAAAVLLSIATSACGGDDGSGNSNPTPTPTPTLDISVTQYFSLSGDENVLYGECVGFTITDAASSFDDDTKLFMIDMSIPVDPEDETAQDFTSAFTVANGLIFVSADGATLTHGSDPDTEAYPCLILPLDPGGFWVPTAGARVVSGNQTAILDDVLIATAPTYTPLAYPGATAGALEQTASFDAYTFDAVAGSFNFVLALSANSALLPSTAIYSDDFGERYLGFDMALVPSLVGVPYRYTISEANLGGGAGFDYSLTLNTTGTLTVDPTPADTCGAAAQGITTGQTVQFVALNDGALTADYDPAGAVGCSDRFAATGVNAPGKDVVYQVIVPDGQTIRVGAAGGGTDVVMMLVTLPNCVATPATCKAASDIFADLDGDPWAGSGTDSLIYRNRTGSAETLYLVVDNFYGAGDTGNVVVVIDIR